VRRKWLAVIVGVTVTALAGTYSILLFWENAGPAPQSAPQGSPIDSGLLHVHYSPRPNFLQDLVRIYRQHAGLACLIAGRADLNRVREAARQHPDVIVPFAWIELDDDDDIGQIDRAHASGFTGLKIHSPSKDYDDPTYFAAFARAEHHGLMVLLHTGISFRPADQVARHRGSAARMQPIYLDTLARAFPRLVLVGAHLGNPWYAEAAEVARVNPNVYFDLSGTSLLKHRDDLAIFRKYLWWGQGEQALLMRNIPHAFEKLVFGSDGDPLELQRNINDYTRLFDAVQVPDEMRRKVLATTMLRHLRLGP
jgi:uncharacterized protein